MAAIPPVVRGEFLYRDVLLVDVGGELKRHPRASESELKALLNGKNVAKDQVGHRWEAQLIHYGLQRSKQKDTAKIRLSQALAQGKLKTQPPHLADMEAQMKKEYAAAVRKATKSNSTPSGKATKRGREEEMESSSKRTKVSVRVGDVSIDIDHGDAVATKKQKKTDSTTKTTKAVAAPKKVAATNAIKASSSVPATPKTSEKPLGKASFSNDNPFQSSASDSRPTPATKSKAAPVKKEAKVKSEPAAPKATPMRPASSTVKHEGYLFDENAMDTRVDMPPEKWEITGVYSIHCPQITEQLPNEEPNLRLFIEVNVESGITWGGFELAMKSGVVKMDEIDFNRKLTFGWRARDSWDNTLRFGKKCFGEIEFDGKGGVYGVFHSMFNEPCEFTGKRRPGPRWSGKSVYKYEQEWDAFPKEAYGR
ncbi:hypothetical protein CB0940_12266 [Cercospora beticola]|uniref:Uncharacterized protein n=1 Tax=Cercospora beticola TaxID=122368 RepID=A0A2G5IEW5_CERBT|nr:hypothetical protein CB0940_12266 [Cercospora beticola]PIB03396.1 hypothetical protein CB0940_12266 [Cercospora beticola]WPB00894.1 hypothetical protein RHO25_005514 [Cercospora beticola]